MQHVTHSTPQVTVCLNDVWFLDCKNSTLKMGDTAFELEHQLCVLLDYFVQHQQKILSKEQLLTDNWPGKVVNDENLTVAISKLRKIFSDNARYPTFIKTIPGVGYQFIAHVCPIASAAKTHTNTKQPLLYVILAMALLATFMIAILVFNPNNAEVDQQSVIPITDNNAINTLITLSDQANIEAIPALVQQWRAILQQQPENAAAYWYIAKLKITLLHWQAAIHPGHFEELDALLQKSLSLNPNNAEAWSWLARLYFWHKQDYAASEQYFNKSLALKPDAMTYYAFAEMLLAQTKFEEAQSIVTIARKMQPHHFAYPGLAWIYQLSGSPEEAWQELQRIKQTELADKAWHVSALQISHQLGMYEESYHSMQWLLSQSEEGRAVQQTVKDIFQTQGIAAVYQFLLQTKFNGDIGHYTPPLSWSRYAILAGDKKTSLLYLQQAAEAFQIPLLWAASDPIYQPIHNSQEFKNWLARINVAPQKPI